MLTLYPVTILKLTFLVLDLVLYRLLGIFPCRQTCHLWIGEFHFFLCNLYDFSFSLFYFCYFTGQNFSTVFIRNSESGHPRLVPNPGGERFPLFTNEYALSSRFLVGALFQIKKLPSIPSFLRDLLSGC